MKIFDKYLTLVVLICMAVGVFVGQYLTFIPDFLERLTFAEISLPIALLIWVMIFPMMLKVDFTSVKNIRNNPKGLYLTWVVNWVVKPFSMFLIASLFFLVIYRNVMDTTLASDYLAGAIILGAAPCTAMVFVWSQLSKGDAAYTLVQVATNNLILLVLFVPIVGLLLGVGGFFIPWSTLFLSVVLFVVVPLIAASLLRIWITKRYGVQTLETRVLPRLSRLTMIGLLLTLILIFSLQSDLIINNPLHIVLISVPLVIQTFFIFAITYFIAYKLRLKHEVAAPAGFIGASNFFELAVAVAIALFPLSPGVALATIVGVLVEVPVMLGLVKIANKTKGKFKKFAS